MRGCLLVEDGVVVDWEASYDVEGTAPVPTTGPTCWPANSCRTPGGGRFGVGGALARFWEDWDLSVGGGGGKYS